MLNICSAKFDFISGFTYTIFTLGFQVNEPIFGFLSVFIDVKTTKSSIAFVSFFVQYH